MKKTLQLQLNLENHTNKIIQQKPLLKIARNLLKKENILGKIEIDLLVVKPKEIQALNKKYLGIDKVTDVLSFPLHEKKDWQNKQIIQPMVLLGIIVIAYSQAQKQAEEENITVEKEMDFLFAHGLKHLLGKHHKE